MMRSDEGVRTVTPAAQHPAEPSVSTALEHVFHASQRVLADRVDLVALDARTKLVLTLAGVALIGLGTILSLAAWCTAMALLVVLIDATLAARLALVFGINAAVGGTLIMLGIRRLPASPAEETNRES